MTILGLVASIVSFSVGQALAKLTGDADSMNGDGDLLQRIVRSRGDAQSLLGDGLGHFGRRD